MNLGNRSYIQIKQSKANAAIGRCIYCDIHEPNVKLGREHIVPRSLGGNATLPKASCRKHEDVTKKIELYAARKMFQHVRLNLGLRMKQPPTHFKAVANFGKMGQPQNEFLVPISDHPGLLVLADFQAPKILQNPLLLRQKQGSIWFKVFEKPSKLKINIPNKASKFYHQIAVDYQAKLLAKIAFCLTISAVGLDSFNSQKIKEIICETGSDWTSFVGGTLEAEIEFEKGKVISALHRSVVFSRVINSAPYAVVQLQLFALYDTPIFTIVVGELTQAGFDKITAFK